ncbi:hypothetical protein C8J57DRAFT_1589158 [Mycena rebaudengoi]|nr:hypothetical protein C8J57DRAFT_1589158 [Mycena rebaudengoi]
MASAEFSFATTANQVATLFADEIKGKIVLVTGTSLNGIGFETARVIAKYAGLVIITGYSIDRLRLTDEAIRKDVPSANIRQLVLDLSSLAAVRKAAEEVNAMPEPLHVLIHNACAAIGPFKLTVDGLESQIATGHLGPFLFTKLLTPKLLASTTSAYTPRVVYVSSYAHKFGKGVNFDTLGNPDPAQYDIGDAYAQTKSAAILTAIELSRRSKGTINAYSLHPGAIFTNVNQRQESKEHMISVGILAADGLPNTGRFPWKTIPQGAATTVAAAFDPTLNDKPGAYLDDSKVATAKDAVAKHSCDPAIAERLWTVTEEIIGEAFTF